MGTIRTIVFSLDSMNEVVLIRISYSYTISVLVPQVLLQVVEVMLVVAAVAAVAAVVTVVVVVVVVVVAFVVAEKHRQQL